MIQFFFEISKEARTALLKSTFSFCNFVIKIKIKEFKKELLEAEYFNTASFFPFFPFFPVADAWNDIMATDRIDFEMIKKIVRGR